MVTLFGSNGILHRFCLTKGFTLISQVYDPSSVVYVSKPIIGPSGGIYYPNFVPCFVVLYLNGVFVVLV